MKAYAMLGRLIWHQGRKHVPELLLVLVVGFFLAGCTTSPVEHVDTRHSALGKQAQLELNHGRKWVVDKPMMAHIRKMEQAVQGFDHTPPKDHRVIAKEVEENLGQLVTNCTLEGRAHDELHKWLMPFLALSADYSKASDPQVQQQKLEGIKQSLLVFNQYFE